MPDTTALEVEARELTVPVTRGFVDDLRTFVGGALLTLVVAAAGTILFTLVLTFAVVASPLIAPAIALTALRRRAEGKRAWTTFHPAVS